jgi:hypothetical protein
MNQLQMINRMLWGGEKDPLLLQLLGNTAGNTNVNWIDTSMYATPAIQENELLKPILTPDYFGVGNYGYVFSLTNSLYIVDYNQLSFLLDDSPFTVKLKFKLTSTPTTNAIISCGISETRRWVIYLSSDRIRFTLFSNGSSTDYISFWIMVAPQINIEYDLKFTYSGSKLASGLTGYLNGTQYNTTRVTVGTYVGMMDINQSIIFGKADYSSIVGGLTNIEIWKGVV